jgi:hypothetical protein
MDITEQGSSTEPAIAAGQGNFVVFRAITTWTPGNPDAGVSKFSRQKPSFYQLKHLVSQR